MQKLIALEAFSDLKYLHDLYMRVADENPLGFLTLENYMKWFEQDANLNYVKMYTFGDNWKQSGLYLIIDRYQLCVNSLKPNDENLGKALRLLDWSHGFKITGVPGIQNQIVNETLKKLNLKWKGVRLNLYRISKEKIAEFQLNCPSEFAFCPLSTDDAALVNSKWPSRQSGSLHFIKRLLLLNESIGLYCKASNELIGWCTRCQCGLLACLHIQEEYRRQGLASIIIKALCLKLQETENKVYALVYEHNASSNALFSKLGFEVIGEGYHKRVSSMTGDIEWLLD